MKLEQQVCSLDLAKRLKELGVNQDSIYIWTTRTEPATLWSLDRYEEHFGDDIGSGYDEFPSFTVAELGEMLPESVNPKNDYEYFLEIGHDSYGWYIVYRSEPDEERIMSDLGEILRDDSEANARAKMLIYLIENNLIKI